MRDAAARQQSENKQTCGLWAFTAAVVYASYAWYEVRRRVGASSPNSRQQQKQAAKPAAASCSLQKQKRQLDLCVKK